ncbi:MAG: hypothetical protein KF872_04255 [Chitinophagales bacterium]|nr:hypothetical protein [Chitinophagales bacterium]
MATRFSIFSFILLAWCLSAVASWSISKQEYFDSSGNFNYARYLSEVDFSEIGAIKHHQKQIDSLGFSGREVLYDVFTTKLFAADSNEYAIDSFAYLFKKIELGKKFKTIGEWDTYDPILYKAIGSYWLDYASTKVQNIVGENRDRVFEYDIRKLRDALIDCNYNFTLPPISKYQKFFLEVTEEYAWTHVLSRFWDRSPIYLKLIAFLGIVVSLVGCYTSFNFIKQKFFTSKS